MLTIKVELSCAQGIEQAAIDMHDLARRLNVWISADFNQTEIIATPSGNSRELAKTYKAAKGKKSLIIE